MGKNAGVHIMKPGLVASLVQHCSDLICKFKKTEQQGRLTMSQQAVKEYLLSIILIYQVSSKAEKSVLLDHAELVTKRERKYLIHRLNEGFDELYDKCRTGRPAKYYKPELLPHIHFLWMQMEQISARRMKAALPEWLPLYDDCPAHLKLQLVQMSASTLERYLAEVRQKNKVNRGISTTSPARYMKNKIPINTLDHSVTEPGHVQADTVAHCGDSAQGPFISSLTVTDIYSGWTENRALFTKQQAQVYRGLRSIEAILPFTIKHFNTDSGSEFLNTTIWRFTGFGNRIKFTRSRPYKKNDNCYVEQKNYTHVRELFGYDRLEDPELVATMNDIYENCWLPLQNFFIPSFKLKEKIRVGAKIRKKYDSPQTPYQRLMQSPALSMEHKQRLQERKLQLNPFALKKELEIKLKVFYEVLRKKTIREAS